MLLGSCGVEFSLGLYCAHLIRFFYVDGDFQQSYSALFSPIQHCLWLGVMLLELAEGIYKVINALELAIDRGKADVGDLVQWF
jgi:hypothetical protein